MYQCSLIVATVTKYQGRQLLNIFVLILVFGSYLFSIAIEINVATNNTCLVLLSFDDYINGGLWSLSNIDNNNNNYDWYHNWCSNWFYDTFSLDPFVGTPIVLNSNLSIGPSDGSLMSFFSGVGGGSDFCTLLLCKFLLFCLQ